MDEIKALQTPLILCCASGGRSGQTTSYLSSLGYDVWKRAMANVTPGVEVRSRRIGGATFQIPSEVRPDRKISLTIKWIVKYSRDRNGRTMADKLSNEIIAASKGEGNAVKK